MSDQLATILMLAAVAVLVVTVVVWVRPLVSRRPVSGPAPAEGGPTPSPTSSSFVGSGPLAQGFGYLFSPLGRARRQTDVGSRLAQAVRRIDSVDPYINHRRIGMALMPRENRDD